jgi:hypothetical protein
MQKRLIVIVISAFLILLIVYLDIVLATSFEAGYLLGDFPMIYLVTFPVMLIIVSILWGKLPSAD